MEPDLLDAEEFEKRFLPSYSRSLSGEFEMLLALMQEIPEIKEPADADKILGMWSSRLSSIEDYYALLIKYRDRYSGEPLFFYLGLHDFMGVLRGFLDANRTPTISSRKQRREIAEIISQLKKFSGQ
jgi:hypothetical protein